MDGNRGPSARTAAQWLAAATGGLLLTAVLTLWRRSAKGTVLVLALQGACLALLALTVAAREADVELFAIAVLTLVVKVAVIPTLLSRVATTGEADETTPVINPTTGMLLAAALTTLAYLVTRSLSLPAGAATANAVPVGISVVLIGFLVLITRRQTLTQAVGFVMIDNGIAATALLAAGGLPVVVELGVTAPWRGVVGEDGLVVGHDGFGISAPDTVIKEHLGFTPAAVAAKIRAWKQA